MDGAIYILDSASAKSIEWLAQFIDWCYSVCTPVLIHVGGGHWANHLTNSTFMLDIRLYMTLTRRNVDAGIGSQSNST